MRRARTLGEGLRRWVKLDEGLGQGRVKARMRTCEGLRRGCVKARTRTCEGLERGHVKGLNEDV